MSTFCVITTIQESTAAVRAWEKIFGERLIVEGDAKTPKDWSRDLNLVRFYPYDETLAKYSTLKYGQFAPKNHYARKNLGYLEAMVCGASSIFETDDDNAPSAYWFERDDQDCLSHEIEADGWCNIYLHFNQKRIWPLGLPLNKVESKGVENSVRRMVSAPIQQGMVSGNPDVDAIWRLVMPRKVQFGVKRGIKSFDLAPGTWCPFNSQSTWWFPEAYPLMYLPQQPTMRTCDIWRSFVAQRCLWAMGKRVVFHAPAEVVQERNAHDLMADFKQELGSYWNNEAICETLGALKLKRGRAAIYDNLRACYTALCKRYFIHDDELEPLEAWIGDVKGLAK